MASARDLFSIRNNGCVADKIVILYVMGCFAREGVRLEAEKDFWTRDIRGLWVHYAKRLTCFSFHDLSENNMRRK